MEVYITKITPVYPDSVFIQWNVIPDDDVSGDYTFTLERSGGPKGPFTTTFGPVLNSVFYADTEFTQGTDADDDSEHINLLSGARDIYYRVTAIAPDGAISTSRVVNLDGMVEVAVDGPNVTTGYLINNDTQAEPSPRLGLTFRPSDQLRKRLLARKIMRDQYLVFSRLEGVEMALYKRKHFGTYCPNCRDPLTQAVLLSKCTICLGTGWTGGFYDPIYTYGKIEVSGVLQDTMQAGQNIANRTSNVQLLAYPRMDKGDVIVEASRASRWIVSSMQPLELHRIPVLQQISANELSHHSIEFYIGT